jgi:hypothetical protein
VAEPALELAWRDGHLCDPAGGRWDAFGRSDRPDRADLPFVRSGVEKWFAWSGIFPGAPLWAPAQSAREPQSAKE